MKTMEEITRSLSQPGPSDPLIKQLNDTFGPLGWEFDGAVLKVMAKISEDHFLSVSRFGMNLEEAAATFGLEVKNAQSNEGQRQVDTPETPQARARPDSAMVGAQGAGVGQGYGESKPTVSAGTPKPSRKVIEDSITAASQVILAKKLKTQDELVAMLQSHGVRTKSQLSDEQALELLTQLNSICK